MKTTTMYWIGGGAVAVAGAAYILTRPSSTTPATSTPAQPTPQRLATPTPQPVQGSASSAPLRFVAAQAPSGAPFQNITALLQKRAATSAPRALGVRDPAVAAQTMHNAQRLQQLSHPRAGAGVGASAIAAYNHPEDLPGCPLFDPDGVAEHYGFDDTGLYCGQSPTNIAAHVWIDVATRAPHDFLADITDKDVLDYFDYDIDPFTYDPSQSPVTIGMPPAHWDIMWAMQQIRWNDNSTDIGVAWSEAMDARDALAQQGAGQTDWGDAGNTAAEAAAVAAAASTDTAADIAAGAAAFAPLLF